MNTNKEFEAGCLAGFVFCVMIGVLFIFANGISLSNTERAARDTAKELLSCPNVEHRCQWQCIDLKTETDMSVEKEEE